MEESKIKIIENEETSREENDEEEIENDKVLNENLDSSPRGLTLQLGDIIEILAPTNEEIHQMTALITYIDNEKIKLVNAATTQVYKISLLENGEVSDESIQKINLFNRAEEKGYARQNHLLPNTWVTIHFGGDIPTSITGEITNLIEDMIEMVTYPEMTYIYIDFEYKGIPEHIPIEKIVIRDKPASFKKYGSLLLLKQSMERGEEPQEIEKEEADIEYTETGEAILSIPESVATEPNILETLQELYVEANAIFRGEKLGPVTQLVEIPESEQRYGIDEQTNDFLDELLSTLPNAQRTAIVMNRMHTIITRFKELRSQFSKFDENQNIYDAKTVGPYYKPLIECIKTMQKRLHWVVPVAKNRRILYDVDQNIDTDDVVQTTSKEAIAQLQQLQDDFLKPKSGNPALEYETLYQQIENQLTPFQEPFDTKRGLGSVRVGSNIEAVLDNLEDFYSSVYSSDDISKRQYVLQQYNLGSSKLQEQVMKTGKIIYTKQQRTANDELSLKSLLMLPECVVRYSAVDGQMSSILEKSNLNQTPFLLYRALRKTTEILPHTIDDLAKEFDYEKLEHDTNRGFLKGIHEFSLDESLFGEEDKFERFLDVVVPKTRYLIQLVKKYMKNNMTFFDVTKQLEPFLIYSTDITYKQYMEIRYLIKNRILEFQQNYQARFKSFSELSNANYNVNVKPAPILGLFSEKKEYADTFFENYTFLSQDKEKTNLSSQEILYRMLQADNSNLYNNIISSMMIALITPENMMEAFAEPNMENMSDLEKIKPTDCNRRYLSKKYTSLQELQKDNNKDVIYFDKEFDDTPYEILEKYKSQQREMNPDLFLEFLMENLIHKHGSSKENAKSMAITLISKKKMVEDGNYAMLEIQPKLPKDVDPSTLTAEEKEDIEREGFTRRKLYYYRRKNDFWIKENDLDEQSFLDTETLFCNIRDACYKNTSTKVCESTDETSERFHALSKKRLLAEFDKRYEVSVEDLEKTLESNIAYYMKMISRTNLLKEIQQYKPNYLANELGKQVSKNEVVESPFLSLRDMILGQDDFTKKQHDICRFVEKFCREPLVTELKESPYWKYCLKTNTKLMPASLFLLAETFVQGRDYQEKLQELCTTCGKLSDDGDSWIDEHSGYVLCKRELSNEEGFDDSGFPITTRDILEKDLGTVVMEALQKKEKPVFESEITETIYNIMSTLSSNLDIPIEGITEPVLRITSEVYEKTLISEAKYLKKIEQAAKQNKKIPSYKDYKNQNLVLITSSVLLVSIQTATPSFKTKKSFPGCVRSFSGYPLDGIEDTTGIKYISCALNKLRSNISVWESIYKFSAETFAKRIEEILKTYIVTRDDVNAMYEKKREYMVLYPELVSVQEHNISKWHHFLPPVVPLDNIHAIRNVGSDFKNDFMDLLRKANMDQYSYYFVAESKVVMFGLGILESINKIVRNKDLVLKTASQIPFLENACCNDSGNKTPLYYFNEEENQIGLYLRSAKSIIDMLSDVKTLSKASLFYHPAFTGIRYPIPSSGYDEETIYSAIIKYCNFDRDLPIPEKLTLVCSGRPQGYLRSWNILEKMEFLKKNGKRYTAEDVKHMMSILNRENTIHLPAPTVYTPLDAWKDIIQKFETANSTVVEEPLRKLLNKVFETYHPKVYSEKPTEEGKLLKNYLLKTNRKLYTEIMTFFDKHGNLSSSEYNRVANFLSKIQEWGGEDLHTVAQYLQNAIYTMSKVYPSVLVEEGEFFKTVPNHWGFSEQHASDIRKFLEKYYKEVEKFKKDAVLLRLLQEIGLRLVELNLFAQHLPVYSEIKKTVNNEEGIRTAVWHSLFDTATTYLLLVYSFYSVIHEYIHCSYDPDLLQMDIQERKQARRANIQASKNDSNTIESSSQNLPDEEEEVEETLREIDIVTGNLTELKERVSALLYAFLNIEEENKKTANLSYAEIIQFVNRSKEKEKRGIIKYLGDMTIEERGIENLFKNYRMGRWNVGQQTGLFKYDKDTYDRERDELLTRTLDELGTGTTDIVTERAMDIYELPMDWKELEEKENADIDAFYDEEAYNILNLGENYMDGAYYEEDQEQED
jgi:hypothetical protein